MNMYNMAFYIKRKKTLPTPLSPSPQTTFACSDWIWIFFSLHSFFLVYNFFSSARFFFGNFFYFVLNARVFSCCISTLHTKYMEEAIAEYEKENCVIFCVAACSCSTIHTAYGRGKSVASKPKRLFKNLSCANPIFCLSRSGFFLKCITLRKKNSTCFLSLFNLLSLYCVCRFFSFFHCFMHCFLLIFFYYYYFVAIRILFFMCAFTHTHIRDRGTWRDRFSVGTEMEWWSDE